LRRRVVSPEAHLREGGRVKRSRLRVASHNLIAAKGGVPRSAFARRGTGEEVAASGGEPQSYCGEGWRGVKTGDALRLSSSKSHRSKTNLCRFHPRPESALGNP